MSIVVRFACEHTAAISETDPAPVCAWGERRIARVVAPTPRIRGVASGPHVRTEDLPAIAVNCAPSGPLRAPKG